MPLPVRRVLLRPVRVLPLLRLQGAPADGPLLRPRRAVLRAPPPRGPTLEPLPPHHPPRVGVHRLRVHRRLAAPRPPPAAPPLLRRRRRAARRRGDARGRGTRGRPPRRQPLRLRPLPALRMRPAARARLLARLLAAAARGAGPARRVCRRRGGEPRAVDAARGAEDGAAAAGRVAGVRRRGCRVQRRRALVGRPAQPQALHQAVAQHGLLPVRWARERRPAALRRPRTLAHPHLGATARVLGLVPCRARRVMSAAGGSAPASALGRAVKLSRGDRLSQT
mmetsp:Transcript_43191/g.141806  ORF Transcript_43191/g.141806 Transcript_43191/m.141806 type:complete len:280 (+) Transcript_43191:753-1592(+)